jgi:capsular polysaccharide export protein
LPVAAALAAARDAGVKTLFCENGYLPKTIVMDPKGINAGNSLMGKPSEFYRAIDVPEDQRAESCFGTCRLSHGPSKVGVRRQRDRRAAGTLRLPAAAGSRRQPDPSILAAFPRYAVRDPVLREGIETYNRRHGTQLKLVVKGASFRSRTHRLRPGLSRISRCRVHQADVDAELIEKCAAVITVNSTVGIEALLHLKPVITLGDAFYAVPGSRASRVRTRR